MNSLATAHDSTNGSKTQLELSELLEGLSPPYSDLGTFDTMPSDGVNERIEKLCALLETSPVTAVSTKLLDRLFSALDPLLSSWQRRNNCEHAAMRMEDLQATYLRHSESRSRMIADLQEKCNNMSLIVKSSRERALLIRRIEDFNRKISDTDEFAAVQKLFEESAISYWLVAKETTQVSRHLETYVKSILQGGETDSNSYEKEGDVKKMLETIAKLKREGTEKDLTIKMCMVHLNKLSNTCGAIVAQDLPRIQKYPELELPDLCKALTRLMSQLMTRNKENSLHSPYRSTSDVSNTFRRSPHRALSVFPTPFKPDFPEEPRVKTFGSLSLETEKQQKTSEMQLEEVMFERDFYHKQNSILKRISREHMGDEDQTSLFEKIEAKEESLRLQIETLAEEREQLHKSETDFEVQMTEKTAQIAKIEALNQKLAKKLQVSKEEKGVNTTIQVSQDEDRGVLLQSIQTLKSEISTLKRPGNSRPPSNLRNEKLTKSMSAREATIIAEEAIQKSKAVLGQTEVKLKALEREWNSNSENKLLGSMKVRRQTCSPSPYVTMRTKTMSQKEFETIDQEETRGGEVAMQTMDSDQESISSVFSLQKTLRTREQEIAIQEATVTQREKQLEKSFTQLKKDEVKVARRKKETISVISSGWNSLLSEVQRIDVYRHQVRPKLTKRSGP